MSTEYRGILVAVPVGVITLCSIIASIKRYAIPCSILAICAGVAGSSGLTIMKKRFLDSHMTPLNPCCLFWYSQWSTLAMELILASVVFTVAASRVGFYQDDDL